MESLLAERLFFCAFAGRILGIAQRIYTDMRLMRVRQREGKVDDLWRLRQRLQPYRRWGLFTP